MMQLESDRELSGRRTLQRLLVIAAILAGLCGMHVLGGEDSSGAHVLPGSTMVGPQVMTTTAAGPIAAGVDTHRGAGHQAMTVCVLFLVVSGAALILQLLTRRAGRRPHGRGRRDVALIARWRRGPPTAPPRPRITLCVLRV